MKKHKYNKVFSFLKAEAYLSKNTEIIENYPEIKRYYLELKLANQLISSKYAMGCPDTILRKDQFRSKLILLAVETSKMMTAYAAYNTNHKLLDNIRVSEKELQQTTDQKLVEKCLSIYESAQAHLSALVAYGITTATQTSLRAFIQEFSQFFLASDPDNNLINSSTQEWIENVAVAENAIENLDLLINAISGTEIKFYYGYSKVRKLKVLI